MPAAANLNQTATNGAGCQQVREAINPDLLTGERDTAADARARRCRDGAACHRDQTTRVVDQQRAINRERDAIEQDLRVGCHAGQSPRGRVEHQVFGAHLRGALQQRRLLRRGTKHIETPLADALTGSRAESELGGVDKATGTTHGDTAR